LTRTIHSIHDYFVLFLCTIVSIGLLFFANESKNIGGAFGIYIDLVGKANAPLESIKRLKHLKDENHFLRSQNARLRLKVSQLQEAELENVRLRKIIGFDVFQKLDYIPAKIVGRQQLASIRTLIIDAGKNKNLKRNMPVISGDGLVGKIISITNNHAVCQLLTDRNFRAAVRIQRSRVTCLYQSTGLSYGLLIGVPLRADVRVGDVVVTSGMSSIFPNGIQVGKVVSVNIATNRLFQEIRVEPSVDFNTLEEVFIIPIKGDARQ